MPKVCPNFATLNGAHNEGVESECLSVSKSVLCIYVYIYKIDVTCNTGEIREFYEKLIWYTIAARPNI